MRSVQRIPLPPGRTARWAAFQFTVWLPLFFRTFLKADVDPDRNLRILWRFPLIPLLVHTYAHDRTRSDRQVFYITGDGSRENSTGRR
ncbi:MAG: hypothetical protein MZV63_30700 [Marinilabiliales bacterium]|nr:hypothetical protein [Marinilabiliales bacterium]